MQGSGVEADLTLEICPNTKDATIRWNNNFITFVLVPYSYFLIFSQKISVVYPRFLFWSQLWWRHKLRLVKSSRFGLKNILILKDIFLV